MTPMTPVDIASRQAARAYRRYQAATTDEDRDNARASMLAWHRAAQLEREGQLPCDECDGCFDFDSPSCGEV